MHIAPPPPPADAPRPLAGYDTECFPNYWLLKVKEKASGQIHSFRLHAGQKFHEYDVYRIGLIFQAFSVVSFNGLNYDVPMISAALAGYTCEQLKWLNDRIIVEKLRPWELGLPEWAPADHVDIMETAPGQGSQKKYAGIIHAPTMRDLPYAPDHYLQGDEFRQVDEYCENDLAVLLLLHSALEPQIAQREYVGKKWGLDLRSKSDAQMAEAVLKKRCEIATGSRIFKPEIDWNLRFRYRIPAYIGYSTPQLQRALGLVRDSIFQLGPKGSVQMPPQLEGLVITIGQSSYRMGIGGLHSQESSRCHRSDDQNQLLDIDVEAYYPSMILNDSEFPPAMGPSFLQEYGAIKSERVVDKGIAKKMKEAGLLSDPEYIRASTGDSGGKIMINGTFGKTNSPYSVLFAPSMFVQTVITGQLSLLMLIEWFELYGIPVVSANTDGIVIKCPRHLLETANYLIGEWERRTNLKMEQVKYKAIYSRDVNNYFAIKEKGGVKRKGEYAETSLVDKKSPCYEICGDAVAAFLEHGTPIAYTIAACRDIRKFLVLQQVNGGAVKLWGEGPKKDAKVSLDMAPRLVAHGWVKAGRSQWQKGETLAPAAEAYRSTFAPQRREYLGKVIRWYYSTQAPGTIVYESNGNTVGCSEGAKPCMVLPEAFPEDVDYAWYIRTAENMLKDIGASIG